MPDRLPPSWGHEPEDGRDLDALLSGQVSLSVEEIQADEAMLAGQLAGVSESQRPVAGAMFALRSAPEGSELAGEPAARAAFRALIAPSGPDSRHTLVLPVQSAGQGLGSQAPARRRHRHRRRTASDRAGWRVMALAGSAAAVAAVGAAALAGAFSGSAGPGGQSANPTAAQLSTAPSASPAGTQRVLGGGQATKDAAPSATPKASAVAGATPSRGTPQTPADLCREYFGFLVHHAGDNWAQEKPLLDQLSKLAGSADPWQVIGYCMKQAPAEHPPPSRQAPPGGGASPGSPYPGNWGGDGRPGGSR
jgi:hypothetical protein